MVGLEAGQLTGLVLPSCPERTPGQLPASSGTDPAGPAETSTPLLPPVSNLQDKENPNPLNKPATACFRQRSRTFVLLSF